MARRASHPAPYPPGWEPFLAAIQADMADDTPRLVFADWLQENGDEDRAAFIRLQCQAQRLRPTDPATARELDAQASILLNANWRRWSVGLPRWLQKPWPSYNAQRGFIHSISISGAQFLRDGATITRLTPIEYLLLSRASVAALRSPILGEVSGLDATPVDTARVEAIAENPHLGRLRYLVVGNGETARGRPYFRISRAAISKLLANPALTGLETVQFPGARHGDTIARALAAAPFRSLGWPLLNETELTADGFRTLIHSPTAHAIRGLFLTGNPLGDEAVRALVESPTATALESVNFADCGLTRRSAELLAGWPGLRSVRLLTLDRNDISEADKALIRANPHARDIQFGTQFA